MVKTIKYSDDEAKTLSLELQAEVLKLKTAISKLDISINSIQDGEYWNGSNAYDVQQALIGHLDHDKTLLNKLEKCSEGLEAIVK